MFKYPFVRQEGFKDCGCACLLMILRYYKGNTTLERLRDLTKTSKSGTSAYNIIDACSKLGFSAKAVRGSINDMEEVILPCIAHVVIDNKYKHYIVIYSIDFNKNRIVIADPDKGIRKISFDYFNKIWTGVLITLYPSSTLPVMKDVKVSKFIFNSVVRFKNDIGLLVLLSLLIIILKIVSSYYFKFIIDGLDINRVHLKSVFLLFFFLTIFRCLINHLRNKFLIIINSKLDYFMTLDAFRRIILLPYRYYHSRTSGEIISKINDLGNSRDTISKICVCLFIDLPLIVISSIFLFMINKRLFSITLLIFVLYSLLSLLYNKIYQYWINFIKEDKERVNSFMYEAISGFETVKGINIENNIIDKFNIKYINLLNRIYKLQSHSNFQGLFKDLIGEIGNLFIIYLGALLVFDGDFSLGYLITYTSMMVYFFEPIRNIIDLDLSFKDSKESITRVLSLYESNDKKGFLNFTNGSILFKNLTYTYDNKKNVLDNINLKINAGEKVMIYGNSGCGKSTLLKILMGYYEVNRGSVFINENDINDYKDLNKNISYISQNEVIFNDSLINNLTYYSKDNSDIVSVSKTFQFNEILDTNLGFNMMIEENGSNLSGGERQRIILARTFLRNSPIILIDEGFSQIDVSLERKILEDVFVRYNDKTILIISHRLENMDLYDKVIHISGGKVIEE